MKAANSEFYSVQLLFPYQTTKNLFYRSDFSLQQVLFTVFQSFQVFGIVRSRYSEEVKLFEERILVRAFSKPIPVGRYFFKFSYVIPEFLPSSFNLDACKRSLQWEDIRMQDASVSHPKSLRHGS